MKTILALALTLFGATALGQSIGDLCDPRYAEADEGFANMFCNRTPLQMRRQLNKMFAANRMLFNPNAAALTPRDQSNRRWLEFPPAPEGWNLTLSAKEDWLGQSVYDPGRFIIAEYTRNHNETPEGHFAIFQIYTRFRQDHNGVRRTESIDAFYVRSFSNLERVRCYRPEYSGDVLERYMPADCLHDGARRRFIYSDSDFDAHLGAMGRTVKWFVVDDNPAVD